MRIKHFINSFVPSKSYFNCAFFISVFITNIFLVQALVLCSHNRRRVYYYLVKTTEFQSWIGNVFSASSSQSTHSVLQPSLPSIYKSTT